MDEDTLRDNTRAAWEQFTDYDLPVTEGTEEVLSDFLQKRSRYEKNVATHRRGKHLTAASAGASY
ncbi:MAG TPA: hypothetical protein VEJ88_00775 [Dissulfurispiraceae bacterium]|nr:hypothetical protein [Dissulfurispiraceae bacterium]